MRNAMLAILAMVAAAGATMGGISPAAAIDYPWCLQGKEIGYPGDCSFSTREQCLASASGRGLDCNVNPIVAFARQRGAKPYRGYDRNY